MKVVSNRESHTQILVDLLENNLGFRWLAERTQLGDWDWGKFHCFHCCKVSSHFPAAVQLPKGCWYVQTWLCLEAATVSVSGRIGLWAFLSTVHPDHSTWRDNYRQLLEETC